MASERGSVDTVSVRHELRPGDVAEVVRLHGEIYAREYGFDASFADYVDEHLRAFAASGSGRLWIAERDAEIVGSIAIVEAPGKDAQLRWFLVVPDARGAGLGRRLMDEALAYCTARGHVAVFLWTVDLLERAARLYRAVGFELAEGVRGRMGGGDVVEQRYVLRLRPAGSAGATA